VTRGAVSSNELVQRRSHRTYSPVHLNRTSALPSATWVVVAFLRSVSCNVLVNVELRGLGGCVLCNRCSRASWLTMHCSHSKEGHHGRTQAWEED
jgi:hypothetical protein